MKTFSQAFVILLLGCNAAQAAISTQTLTVRATVVKPCQITWGAPMLGAPQLRTDSCEIAISARDEERNRTISKPTVMQSLSQPTLSSKEPYIIEHAASETTIKF